MIIQGKDDNVTYKKTTYKYIPYIQVYAKTYKYKKYKNMDETMAIGIHMKFR